MQIYGLNKTTLLDYPGHVAATLFTGGCNFRCPYCHNSTLILHPDEEQQIPEEEIFTFLRKRQGILEGVCITGGEPTLQPDLKKFIRQIKNLGYLVKLDTNGYRPEVVRELLDACLLDYIAMDVKAAKSGYEPAAGVKLDASRLEESMELIRSSGVDYEFRTTVVKGLHRLADFEEIGRWLAGCRAYYLQSYREDENVLQKGYDAFSREELEDFARAAEKNIDKVALRGVE